MSSPRGQKWAGYEASRLANVERPLETTRRRGDQNNERARQLERPCVFLRGAQDNSRSSQHASLAPLAARAAFPRTSGPRAAHLRTARPLAPGTPPRGPDAGGRWLRTRPGGAHAAPSRLVEPSMLASLERRGAVHPMRPAGGVAAAPQPACAEETRLLR